MPISQLVPLQSDTLVFRTWGKRCWGGEPQSPWSAPVCDANVSGSVATRHPATSSDIHILVLYIAAEKHHRSLPPRAALFALFGSSGNSAARVTVLKAEIARASLADDTPEHPLGASAKRRFHPPSPLVFLSRGCASFASEFLCIPRRRRLVAPIGQSSRVGHPNGHLKGRAALRIYVHFSAQISVFRCNHFSVNGGPITKFGAFFWVMGEVHDYREKILFVMNAWWFELGKFQKCHENLSR